MRSRPVPSGAATLAGAVGAVRLAIGAGALAAPRAAAAVLLRSPPSPATTALLRMFAGREIALGLGTVRAAAREGRDLRGWVAASALADAADVVALAADRGRALRPVTRWGALLGASTVTLAAPLLARALERPDGGRRATTAWRTGPRSRRRSAR